MRKAKHSTLKTTTHVYPTLPLHKKKLGKLLAVTGHLMYYYSTSQRIPTLHVCLTSVYKLQWNSMSGRETLNNGMKSVDSMDAFGWYQESLSSEIVHEQTKVSVWLLEV